MVHRSAVAVSCYSGAGMLPEVVVALVTYSVLSLFAHSAEGTRPRVFSWKVGPVESNAKCTIVDEQDGGSVEQACGPPSSGPLCEAVAKGLVENRKVRGKRKRRNAEQPLDGTHAPVLDGCDQTVVEDQGPSPNRPKKQKNRCFVCRKKVGLTGFDCRCGNVFCGIHRYTDMHECTFDYKAEAAEKIRKENPVVIAEKIHKI